MAWLDNIVKLKINMCTHNLKYPLGTHGKPQSYPFKLKERKKKTVKLDSDKLHLGLLKLRTTSSPGVYKYLYGGC